MGLSEHVANSLVDAKIKGYIPEEISDNLREHILNYPLGQVLTAKWKKPTYKGPYNESIKNLKSVGDPIALYPKFILVDTSAARSGSDNIYFVYKTIGDTKKGEVITKDTKLQEEVRVYKRNSYISRLSEIKNFMDIIPEEHLKKLATHIKNRKKFSIGDTGFYNILWDGTQLYGIDYEEKSKDPKKYFGKLNSREKEFISRFIEN